MVWGMGGPDMRVVQRRGSHSHVVGVKTPLGCFVLVGMNLGYATQSLVMGTLAAPGSAGSGVVGREEAYSKPILFRSAMNLGSDRRTSNVGSTFSQAIQTSRSS